MAAKEAVEEGVTDGVQSGTTSVSDSSPCVEAEVEECAQEQNSGEAASGSSKGAPEDRYSPFECNICFDVAQDPVVTRCGHLYWCVKGSVHTHTHTRLRMYTGRQTDRHTPHMCRHCVCVEGECMQLHGLFDCEGGLRDGCAVVIREGVLESS